MKLSEAIRLGAMVRPQAVGGLYAVREIRNPGEILALNTERVDSCAMGAAFEAAGCRSVLSTPNPLARTFRGDVATGGGFTTIVPVEWHRILWLPELPCPACESRDVLMRMIPHLNDFHHWTRERIAAWVETIEQQQAAAAVDQGGRIAELEAVHARLKSDLTPA